MRSGCPPSLGVFLQAVENVTANVEVEWILSGLKKGIEKGMKEGGMEGRRKL